MQEPSFAFHDVVHMTDGGSFNRGESYYRQGRVLEISHDPSIDTYFARVAGSSQNLYEVELYWSGEVLQSSCTCPVEFNCKHGVAVALKVLAEPPPDTRGNLNDWQQWLAGMPDTERPAIGAMPPGRHYLRYDLAPTSRGFRIQLRKGYLKQDGSWSQLRDHYLDISTTYWRPDYMQDSDAEVQRLLESDGGGSLRVVGRAGHLALKRLLSTKRFFFRDRPLHAGPSRGLRWKWLPAPHDPSMKQLHGALEALEEWQLIDVEPPLYLASDSNTLGDIVSNISAAQLMHLLRMPPVAASDLLSMALELRRRFSEEALPLPVDVQIEQRSEFIPRLTLVTVRAGSSKIPAALLDFDYGGIAQAPFYGQRPPTSTEIVEQGGRYVQLQRNLGAESACLNRLRDLNLYPATVEAQTEAVWVPRAESQELLVTRWQQFVDEALPGLEDEGWQVRRDDEFVLSQATFQLEIRDAPDNWFDFSLSLPVGDGREVDTLTILPDWLERGAPAHFVVNIEGDWLEIDARPLQQIRDLIADLLDQDRLGSPARLPSFQALRFDEPDLDQRHAPLTRRMHEQLREFAGVEPVTTPAGLRAELREYQRAGLNWLAFLQRFGFGGILADDMGLGKTLQTLALIQHLKETGKLERPALVVAPTSLTGNWKIEAARFTPQLRVLLLQGPERTASFSLLPDSDLVITSYALLARDSTRYGGQSFCLLVLDEAQAIKNPRAKVSACVRDIDATMRLCLTGTPLENHLGELWALMDFALPGLLGGRKTFNTHFRNPVEKEGDRAQQDELGRRLAPFMLRRRKSAVAEELPPKTEALQYVELQGNQRTLYEAIRASMEARIQKLVEKQGMARSHIEFLDALLKMRQACIDPRLVKLDAAKAVRQSAKLEWLAENLPQLIEEGRRILLFSQFTQALTLVQAELERMRISFTKLTGQTRKRQEAIERFQSGAVPVFLISLKAGGSGLNLTAADVVIHLDPWWNPAVENQATDRAHRIGQDKPVLVYKLVARDTVEERILQMQSHKRDLADAIFDSSLKSRLPRNSDELLSLLTA